MGSDEVAAKGIINVQNCLMLSPVQNDYKLLLGFDPKNEKDNNAGDLTLSTRFVWTNLIIEYQLKLIICFLNF